MTKARRQSKSHLKSQFLPPGKHTQGPHTNRLILFRERLLCVISSFRHGVKEVFALLRRYAALIGSQFPACWDNLSFLSSRVKQWTPLPLKTGTTGCPERTPLPLKIGTTGCPERTLLPLKIGTTGCPERTPLPLKKGTTGSPDTPVTDYQSALHNVT